jgi:hypothetical protein
MREQAAVHRSGGGVRDGSVGSGCCECFLAECAQGVVTPAGEFARNGEHCSLVSEASADGEVVVVVRGGGAGGADGGLEQRPAQQAGALAGQVASAARRSGR